MKWVTYASLMKKLKRSSSNSSCFSWKTRLISIRDNTVMTLSSRKVSSKHCLSAHGRREKTLQCQKRNFGRFELTKPSCCKGFSQLLLLFKYSEKSTESEEISLIDGYFFKLLWPSQNNKEV